MAFFSTASTTPGVQGTTSTAAEKDVEVPEPPTDSISSLAFSTQADYLAVGSWDNSVRVFSRLSEKTSSSFGFRYESMKWGLVARLKEKLCTSTVGRY